MELSIVGEAAELLEKANADLDSDLVSADAARAIFATYERVVRLGLFGRAVMARKIDEASEVARMTGTSLGRAKETVETSKALRHAPEVSEALKSGDISLDQAAEIAKAEQARPGSSAELLALAHNDAFRVLRDQARKIKLEAEQHQDLGSRQHHARSARTYGDDLGMIHVHLAFEPHVGTPIVNRAEADAARIYRKAKSNGEREPFERVLADAYVGLLSGAETKGRPRRPELVVLVSHEVATRGWKDVRDNEVCKIPGVGPISPVVAKKIAADALLSGVFYDGRDLRQFRRWTRNTPIEVRVALELGEPPGYDGVRCVDCGNRFRTENDHVEPHTAGSLGAGHVTRPRPPPT